METEFADHGPVRVVIVGAGAIGGLLGTRISCQTKHEVIFVARGAHLAAMRAAGGLTLLPSVESSESEPIQATSAEYVASLSEVSSRTDIDFVVLAIKEHQIAPIVDSLVELLVSSPSAAVVTTQNGVPWWFFQRNKALAGNSSLSALQNKPILSVDPGGKVLDAIDPSRIVGCVVYPAASIAEPGKIRHHEGERFPVGELDGNMESARIKSLSGLLVAAGFKSPILPDIRSEMWLKLWGSAAFNPISALTHATLAEIGKDGSPTRKLVERVMDEVEVVGKSVGLGTMRVPREKRINGAVKVGQHKTSMLQDVEAGRDMELDALIGSVIELAEATQTAVPHLYTLHRCCCLLQSTIRKLGCGVASRGE